MRPAVSLRILLCVAVFLAFGGCARTLTLKAWNLPESSPVRDADLIKTEMLPPDPQIDSKRRTLELEEEKLLRGEDPRGIVLSDLARLCFIIGEFGEKVERESWFEKGRGYSELLCEEQPDRVEGHYWGALNLAGLAQCGSAKRALKLLPLIVEQLEIATSLDASYDQAGAHRVLGRIYGEAPAWPFSEGNVAKSLQHLQAAVGINPENSTNHLYLAETLLQLDRIEDARNELERVLTASLHSVSARNLEEDRSRALELISQCKRAERALLGKLNAGRTAGHSLDR